MPRTTQPPVIRISGTIDDRRQMTEQEETHMVHAKDKKILTRLYTYACHEDEAELCGLELRTLFRKRTEAGIAAFVADPGTPAVGVSRSPFLKRRLDAAFRSETLEGLIEELDGYDLSGQTFKVYFTDGDERHTYKEKRELERRVGANLTGTADMRSPQRRFGLARFKGEWLFGPCEDNDATWLSHQAKPQNYSTALPTRAARALVNIAAGSETRGVRLVDPCCGMGTVLIEALSMGIDTEGFEINPLAVRGARANLAHFGYSGQAVTKGDMLQLQAPQRYDAAILDMPYNLCSVLPSEEQLAMLRSLRRMADRAVVVTTENIVNQLVSSDFRVVDGAKLSKGTFKRFISVVE
ncbi:RsmD family RNA methyltransferase [Paenibacillus sp. LHD-117]|uniref:TRM11 family SAM-dependent methyltransferase n=1 Tax=Paenibacillus sp. LHD-117 TaxID=3071412 RepID=UPI0027E041C5|nr:methyltransferase domain-containing protein [Paenibacillus sp. LHD-117]MDQ6420067.1 RsmD family RNA methyltransferase [Paenibacillus sp. LHD-117]